MDGLSALINYVGKTNINHFYIWVWMNGLY